MSGNLNQLDIEAVSQRYFAAWEARDPEAIISLHAEDTQFWTHLGAGPVRGKGPVREAFEALFGQFPGFSFEVYRVVTGSNHWVLDWALIDGAIRFDCLDLVEVSDDGLVTRKDTFVDGVQLEAAMRAAAVPGGAEEKASAV